jgi:peptidoglycan biosynthesis protein MviN/MurJ (putative lipid II flippase)
VREQLVAAAFGASAATDAFNVAFRIPNLFRRLFAEGAFSQAFVPVLAATRASEGDAATHRSSTPWPPCWPGRCCWSAWWAWSPRRCWCG